MMKITTKIISFVLLVALSTIPFSTNVLADQASTCANYTTTDSKTACQIGYNDPTGNSCPGYTDAGLRKACSDASTQATKDKQANGGTNQNGSTAGSATNGQQNKGGCGGAQTEIIKCDQGAGVGAINGLIRIAVIVLTVIIGIVAVGGIAYAAILYASAQNNQSQTQQAIGIVRNVVIGLLLYVFMIAIINWLIPGGVIG